MLQAIHQLMATNDPFILVGLIIGSFFAIIFGLLFILSVFLTFADRERRNGR